MSEVADTVSAATDDANAMEGSRATLVEHLTELRKRLIISLSGLLVFFFVCFGFAKHLYNLLLWPYLWAAGPHAKVELIFTAPHEFLFTQIKVAFFGALFLGFPLMAFQLYRFIAPGLYKRERAAFVPYLVATPLFFIMGAAFVYLLAMPMAMTFFLGMQQAVTAPGEASITLLPKVDEYLNFMMALILAFGLTFQLPVVLTLMGRLGLISSQFLRDKRRYAVVGVFIAAAILTPPDVFSQFALAVPTLLLYELSIFSVRWAEKRHARQQHDDVFN